MVRLVVLPDEGIAVVVNETIEFLTRAEALRRLSFRKMDPSITGIGGPRLVTPPLKVSGPNILANEALYSVYPMHLFLLFGSVFVLCYYFLFLVF
jgi:hypothetical protein